MYKHNTITPSGTTDTSQGAESINPVTPPAIASVIATSESLSDHVCIQKRGIL